MSPLEIAGTVVLAVYAVACVAIVVTGVILVVRGRGASVVKWQKPSAVACLKCGKDPSETKGVYFHWPEYVDTNNNELALCSDCFMRVVVRITGCEPRHVYRADLRKLKCTICGFIGKPETKEGS